jgi:hypothetical protein
MQLSPLRWILTAVFVYLGVFVGCTSSDSTSPQGMATVRSSTEMGNPSVHSTATLHGSVPLAGGATCDSIHVTRARFVMSELKLHHESSDTAGSGTIKGGTFLAVFNAGSSVALATVLVPEGTYSRAKVEVHKLSDVEISVLGALFVDFTIGGARNTLIVEGTAYQGGASQSFVFVTSRTENVEMTMSPAVQYQAGMSYDFAMRFEPSLFFGASGGAVLDPRDETNRSEIETNIGAAFRAAAQ